MDRAEMEALVMEMVKKAKGASRSIAAMPTAPKNTILLEVGEALWLTSRPSSRKTARTWPPVKAGLSSAML